MLQCGEGNSRADFIAPLREACEAPERANEQIPTGTGTALHVRQQRDSSTMGQDQVYRPDRGKAVQIQQSPY